jgi:RND family efflux transporter MFP subunit
MRLTKQAAAWAFAGFVAVTLAGLTVALLSALPGRSHSGSAAPGQSGDQPAPPNADTGRGQERALRVMIVRPTREHLQRVTTQQAHVDPHEKTAIYAKAAGYLLRFGQVPVKDGEMRDVDIGDWVQKDQLLAELWIPEMVQGRLRQAALVDQAQSEVGEAEAAQKAAEALVEAALARSNQARSEVTRYEADLVYHKGEYERYLRLFNERAVQQDLVDKEYHQFQAAEAALAAARDAVGTAQANVKVEQARVIKAKADVESAKARAQVARANLEQTLILLDYAKILAPYQGVITRRLVDSGAFIQSAETRMSEPLFTIVRVDPLRIVTEIPEADSTWVKLGQPAVLEVNGVPGRQFTGKVVRFADALDSVTRTMRTEVELDKPPSGLRPGMYGTVTVRLVDYPDALLLPTSALVISDGKPSVIVVEDGVARRRPIELGYNDGDRMQITRGLKGDEQVITDGKNSVREGQAVDIAK